MKYAIYQIQLTSEQTDAVNNGENVPAFKAKIEMQLDFNSNKSAQIADDAMALGYYTHVANIDAADFNAAFEIGNIGPENKIERLNRMHSVSVGDVIIDEEGNAAVVNSFGFTLFGFRPELAA